jgi:hypothetical protein
MELALGISILGLQLVIVGWLLAHSLQCGRVRERLSALEQWKRDSEEKE